MNDSKLHKAEDEALENLWSLFVYTLSVPNLKLKNTLQECIRQFNDVMNLAYKKKLENSIYEQRNNNNLDQCAQESN